MNQKMIYGNPVSSMITFAIPLILGNLLQQLYSIADSIIVGQTLGQNALAAVASSSTLSMFFVCIINGLSMGCMVVIAQLFGAKKLSRMLTAIYTSIIFMAVLSVICFGISFALGKPILHAMNTPDEIFGDAWTYFFIYILGFPGVFIYNISNSTFNALGKSKMPLLFLAFSSVLNVGLDLLFILKFGWGVGGAALATIISQYLAAILAFVSLLIHLHKNYKPEEKYALFEFRVLGNVAKVAVPTCIQQSVVSFGVIFFQALVNSFGTDVIAGFAAAVKIDGVAVVPILQIGQAAATFAAQNIGAQKPERVKKGYRTALGMTAVIWAVMAILIWIFGKNMVGWFMDSSSSANAIAIGAQYIQISSLFYIIFGIMNNTAGVIRGAGDVTWSLLTLVVNFGIRVVVSYTFVWIFHSYMVLIIAIPCGWAVAALFAYLRYKSGKWKEKSIVAKI